MNFESPSKAAIAKRYKVRFASKSAQSTVVGFPYEFVEREANKVGMKPKQFTESYTAVAYIYDSGVYYIFERNIC